MSRDADIRLLQNGAVHLFWRAEVLDQWCSELAGLGYATHAADCTDQARMRDAISQTLRWQDQFGYGPWTGNLDALNDGMRGFPFGPSQKALLVLRRFDVLVRAEPRFAETMLDIIEYQARNHLLDGNRLLALVQTDDPTFRTPALGGRAAMWNPQEWSDTARGL